MITSVLVSLLFGSLIGLSLGTVGGGGSILTVPILVYAIGQPVQSATTTSLAIVGLNALVGMIGHLGARHVDVRTGLAFGVVGIGGAFFGSWLNSLVPGTVLLVAFAIVMIFAAIGMIRRRSVPAELIGNIQDRANAREWLKIVLSGTVVGLMTGFFGVGGGFIIVPALVLVLGLSMRIAIGTSLLIIAINSAVSLLAHLQFGGLDMWVGALFILGGIPGALIGARLAGRLPQRRLTQTFAAMIILVAGFILTQNLVGMH